MFCIYYLRGEAHFLLFLPKKKIQAFSNKVHVHYHILARPGGATVARLTPVQKVACSNHVRVNLSFLFICDLFTFDYRTLKQEFAPLNKEDRRKYFFIFVHNLQIFKLFRKRDVLIKDDDITSSQPSKRDVHVHET